MSSCILHESLTIWISLVMFSSGWICIQSPCTFSSTTWKTFILSCKLYGKTSLKLKETKNIKTPHKHCEVAKSRKNYVIYNYWHMVAACLVGYQIPQWHHPYTKLEDIHFPQIHGKYTIQVCTIVTFPSSLSLLATLILFATLILARHL